MSGRCFCRYSARASTALPPEARHFVDRALRRVRLLEDFPLRADDKGELLPTMRLYLPQVSDEFDDIGPVKVSGKTICARLAKCHVWTG